MRGQPVEGRAGAAGPVHRGRADQHDLVGQPEHPGHGGVQQAGTAVGDADRVVVLQHLRDVLVVAVAERHGHGRVAVGGQHLEAARRLRGVGAHVGVPLDLVLLVEQVPDRGRRFQPQLVAQRAAVGVRVDGDDPVAPQGRQRGAEADRGGRLAHAALEAQHRDPVMTARDRGPGPLHQVLAAPVSGGLRRPHQAAGDLVEGTAPAGRRRGVPPAQQQVRGQAVRRLGLPPRRFPPARPPPPGPAPRSRSLPLPDAGVAAYEWPGQRRPGRRGCSRAVRGAVARGTVRARNRLGRAGPGRTGPGRSSPGRRRTAPRLLRYHAVTAGPAVAFRGLVRFPRAERGLGIRPGTGLPDRSQPSGSGRPPGSCWPPDSSQRVPPGSTPPATRASRRRAAWRQGT